MVGCLGVARRTRRSRQWPPAGLERAARWLCAGAGFGDVMGRWIVAVVCQQPWAVRPGSGFAVGPPAIPARRLATQRTQRSDARTGTPGLPRRTRRSVVPALRAESNPSAALNGV